MSADESLSEIVPPDDLVPSVYIDEKDADSFVRAIAGEKDALTRTVLMLRAENMTTRSIARTLKMSVPEVQKMLEAAVARYGMEFPVLTPEMRRRIAAARWETIESEGLIRLREALASGVELKPHTALKVIDTARRAIEKIRARIPEKDDVDRKSREKDDPIMRLIEAVQQRRKESAALLSAAEEGGGGDERKTEDTAVRGMQPADRGLHRQAQETAALPEVQGGASAAGHRSDALPGDLPAVRGAEDGLVDAVPGLHGADQAAVPGGTGAEGGPVACDPCVERADGGAGPDSRHGDGRDGAETMEVVG